MSTQYKPVTQEIVQHLFPEGPSLRNVNKYFTTVRKALEEYGLTSPEMQLVAYATIRAESAAFAPILEGESEFNTMRLDWFTTTYAKRFNKKYAKFIPMYANRVNAMHGNKMKFPVGFNGGGIVNTEISLDRDKKPWGFDGTNLYEFREKKLGNTILGDGKKYVGRGFVQLTGKENYTWYAERLHLPALITNPDLALNPDIAAKLLALFLLRHKVKIEHALKKGDLASARKAVNGGSNGLKEFTEAFNKGKKLIEPKTEQIPLKQEPINLL